MTKAELSILLEKNKKEVTKTMDDLKKHSKEFDRKMRNILSGL